MTHQDAGKYAKKHPENVTLDLVLAEAIRRELRDGRMGCAAAERLAEQRSTALGRIGQHLDLLEIRIDRCQLGLFGYGAERKAVSPPDQVPVEWEKAIRGALVEGKLPCARAWELAKTLNQPRMALAAACEKLGVKIAACQLGAF